MNSLPSDPTQTAGAAVIAHTHVHDGEGVSCGEFLRRARERRGLTLQQIAQGTKIPLRHLNALERDEFAALPGGMYRRAEVRAYADAVGLDRNVALAWLDRALEQSMPETAFSAQASGLRQDPMVASGRIRVLMTAGVAVTSVAIALAIWARQPGAGDIASLAAPVSPPASSVGPAPHSANHVLVATSGSTIEPGSAPLRRRAERATVPPLSKAQPQMERSDGSTTAASGPEPQFTVMTEPVGAHVTVNGVRWGITPVTIRYLDPGIKRVRVTRDGYRAEERSIQIETGGPTTTLLIPMRPQTHEDGSSLHVLRANDGTQN
jgi:cytoskeletal protein RodZ